MTASLRDALPFLLGVLFVFWFEAASRRRGLDPPGLRRASRRVVAATALAFAVAVTAFGPLAAVGGAPPAATDFARVAGWELFVVHAVLVASTLVWFAAAYGGSGERFGQQLGLATRQPLREIGVGVLFGIAAWVVVLGAAWAIAAAVSALGGEDLVPRRPPAAVSWLAAQSVLLRAGLALSAGVVEEIFFRGLLQPRVGLLASTALFALAHLSYGQPFLLVGITLLSLLYGLLVRWRQSLWAAIAAHALFDLVQLLVVVPSVLRQFGGFFAE